jgi:hypothetical protein
LATLPIPHALYAAGDDHAAPNHAPSFAASSI